MKSLRFYRANKTKNGFAAEFQLSYKENEKFDKYMLFLTIAPQTGVDENDNATFSWKENSITVKLGTADVGELISVLEGRQNSVGSKGSLYHETPGGGSKVVKLDAGESGFKLNVSAQDKDKKVTGPYYITVTNGEAAVLLTLLRRAVERLFDW